MCCWYSHCLSFQILASLAAAASAAPQIVPYVHEEIEAEPYVHQEIPAEPYVHEEPELSPEALGIIDRSKPAAAPVAAAPQQFAAPVQQQFVPQQQQFVVAQPQQFAFPQQQQLFLQPQQLAAGPVQGVWTGTCLNNLGEGVPCRQKF